MGAGISFHRLKLAGTTADPSSTCSAKLVNIGPILPLPQTSSNSSAEFKLHHLRLIAASVISVKSAL
jgi:hypothetical protein